MKQRAGPGCHLSYLLNMQRTFFPSSLGTSLTAACHGRPGCRLVSSPEPGVQKEGSHIAWRHFGDSWSMVIESSCIQQALRKAVSKNASCLVSRRSTEESNETCSAQRRSNTKDDLHVSSICVILHGLVRTMNVQLSLPDTIML